MLNAIIFDTMDFFKELTTAGMPESQADALTKATTKAFNQMMQTNDLVTKNDLSNLEKQLQGFIIKSLMAAVVLIGGIQSILIHFH